MQHYGPILPPCLSLEQMFWQWGLHSSHCQWRYGSAQSHVLLSCHWEGHDSIIFGGEI